MSELELLRQWPVDNVAGALLKRGDVLDEVGDATREFPVASVTKLVSSYAIMLAVEEGTVELDQPAGPEGATLEHLLAHASGVKFDSREQQNQ